MAFALLCMPSWYRAVATHLDTLHPLLRMLCHLALLHTENQPAPCSNGLIMMWL